jgi:hypothetical protein
MFLLDGGGLYPTARRYIPEDSTLPESFSSRINNTCNSVTTYILCTELQMKSYN